MLLKLLCRIFDHKWRHNPGKMRYVTCKRCDKLPESQWDTLLELRRLGRA